MPVALFTPQPETVGLDAWTLPPPTVLASAAVVCNAIIANRYGQGSLVYSQVYLKETVCVTGSTIASCSGGNAQTLSGVLDAHVEQPMPSLP